MQPNFWTLSSGFYPMARWRQTECWLRLRVASLTILVGRVGDCNGLELLDYRAHSLLLLRLSNGQVETDREPAPQQQQTMSSVVQQLEAVAVSVSRNSVASSWVQK
jgi:hypothetical protein